MQRDVGVVVIGRNEGERLERCLQSVVDVASDVVYVDSGSTDDSVRFAKSVGAAVVELDLGIPFSAARARNEGFRALLETDDSVRFVQFIDGDCELVHTWVECGRQFLLDNTTCAVVAGRRRERHLEASIYNRLCDIEWNTPTGEVAAVGGDFLARTDAFRQVGGFNPSVVAGEEPELCYRLREAGWRIHRIQAEMTVHDAAMFRFRQWWKRAKRTGHAYAHGYFLHRAEHNGYYAPQTRKAWLWALALPAFVGISVLVVSPTATLILLLYPLQMAKIAVRERGRAGDSRAAIAYGVFTVLAKWPQLLGQLAFLRRSALRREIRLLEYK